MFPNTYYKWPKLRADAEMSLCGAAFTVNRAAVQTARVFVQIRRIMITWDSSVANPVLRSWRPSFHLCCWRRRSTPIRLTTYKTHTHIGFSMLICVLTLRTVKSEQGVRLKVWGRGERKITLSVKSECHFLSLRFSVESLSAALCSLLMYCSSSLGFSHVIWSFPLSSWDWDRGFCCKQISYNKQMMQSLYVTKWPVYYTMTFKHCVSDFFLFESS